MADGHRVRLQSIRYGLTGGGDRAARDWAGRGSGRRKDRIKANAAPWPPAARDQAARLAAALGHPARLQILEMLACGPASYRQLAERTGRLAGPLYHHLRQLELGGLVMRPKRDAYQASDRGIWVTAFLHALERLVR